MNEARRQHYLKAMGIPMWYARTCLPGAKASPDFDFSGLEEILPKPVSGTGKAPATGAPEVRARGKQAAAELAASLSVEAPAVKEERRVAAGASIPEPSEQAAAVPVENPPVAGAESSVDSDVEPFTLHVYVANGLLLLNAGHPETDAHREARLLANLVRSCFGSGDSLRSCLEFTWPVFTNPRLPGQGREVAQAVLTGSLTEYLESVKGVVLFGQLPVWSGLAAGQLAATQDLPLLSGARQSLPVQVTHSLGELLLQPQLKRDVWLHLRSFLQTS